MERRVAEQLRSALGPLGLEAHAFKVGWYNAVLQPAFHLPYPDDTLAFVVLSTPSMFDKALKPFVSKERLKIIRDPVDQCVSHHLSRVKEKFPDQRVDIMFDYEMLPSRKPKFLAQTAAHIAGAAYYYQRKDVKLDPWGKKVPFLEQPPPVDCVSSEEKRIELLELFNFHWQDGRYRDIIEVKERYSEEQKTYFATPPAERFRLLGLSQEAQRITFH
ncbi:cyanocobalamin reductase / alkylcobalamin dealkylase isoform X3 [Molothrus aeneus]|uniref:cyanocobalamin reductase / alkylcobalamin dealkylase isoform X3 n=1 Tax=Molothrus aeneus TaxID=84833 RepID=UPI003457CBC7